MYQQIMGFEDPIQAIVIGGRGGIGGQFVQRIALAHPENEVIATGRSQSWVDDGDPLPNVTRKRLDLLDVSDWIGLVDSATQKQNQVNCVVNCSGVLHDGSLQPERSWRHIDIDNMQRLFAVNATGVAVAIKHLLPLLDRSRRGVFASLSARVGSITDNRLGGWYGYRASKAAQHMLLKCAAVEASRLYKKLVCVALHPGTVDTNLSKPFTGRTPAEKLFSAERSADYLLAVLAELKPSQSGKVFAWDGSEIEY